MGLIYKLVFSALLVLVMMIVGLVLAMQSTFETNLSDYLKRVEVEQITPLATLLGEEYARSGSWDYLTATPQTWPGLVSRVLGKVRPADTQLDDMSMEVIGMLPRLTVSDAEGNLVMRSPMPPRQQSLAHQLSLPIIANGVQVGSLLMVPTPVPVSGLDRQFRNDQLQTFYLAAIPVLVITFLIAIPLGLHFAKPLQRLARGIHRLAVGDYDVRLTEERNDELGELAADFNHLADALQRAEEQRREGMASVSHELRTPLATMITAVDAMQDGIRPLDAEQLHRLSGTMEHLNTLVDDLYQLALADVGKLVCRRENIDWTAVTTEAVESMQGKLEERGLQLRCELASGVMIAGDALRLRQVVTNLLENCRRYTEDHGVVTVRLMHEGERGVMTISDSGPGVNRDNLEVLFDRFSRVDVSRSREHGGAGLGLSLVKAIVEAHEGTVMASHAEEGGLRVAVSLALA